MLLHIVLVPLRMYPAEDEFPDVRASTAMSLPLQAVVVKFVDGRLLD